MKKNKKLIITIIISIFAFCFIPYNNCMAMSNLKYEYNRFKIADQITPSTVQGGGNPPTISETIKDVSPSYIDSSNYTELQKTIGYVLGFLQIASGLTAVIMIAFTGFKLIFEVNPKVVEETKKTMFPIVLGIVMVFGAVSIGKFIIGAVE